MKSRRRRKSRALRVSVMEEGATFEGLRQSEHDGGFETKGASMEGAAKQGLEARRSSGIRVGGAMKLWG